MEEESMRVYHVLALVLILSGWEAVYFSPTKVAEAGKQAALNNDLDIFEMQRGPKDLPAQNLHDFTLVFGTE
jgi:hypothetical protein